MNVENVRNSMLADLNEVQLDLAVNGDNERSEKIRGVKQRLLGMKLGCGTPSEPEELVISGYRDDALCQCDRVREILEKIAQGDPATDNELMFVKLAADQLSSCIHRYFATRIAAECPGIMEA